MEIMSEPTDYERLLTSWLPTRRLAHMALTWNEYTLDGPRRPIWQHISHSQDAAREFYSLLDEEELRELAVDALVSSGWTLSRINYKVS